MLNSTPTLAQANPPVKFGTWFRRRREALKLSQTELSQALGLKTSQLISNVERGINILPAKHVPTISEKFGVSKIDLELRLYLCHSESLTQYQIGRLIFKYLPLLEAMESGHSSNDEFKGLFEKLNETGLIREDDLIWSADP